MEASRITQRRQRNGWSYPPPVGDWRLQLPRLLLWCAELVLLNLFWAIATGPDVHGPCRRVLNRISHSRWALGGSAILWVGIGIYLNTVIRDILLLD